MCDQNIFSVHSKLTAAHLTLLFILFCNVTFCQTQNGSPIEISLKEYNVLNESGQVFDKMITIPSNITSQIIITNLPNVTNYFLICQVHTFRFNVTVSYKPIILPHMYITGSNIGLYFASTKGLQIPFYILNSNQEPVISLIAVTVYVDDVPVPGGCNMEFYTEFAPYLRLSYTDILIKVDAQAASMLNLTCNSQKIKYDMYHMYLPEQDFTSESYFNGIRSLLNVPDILRNARKVPTPINGPQLRRTYSAYHGLGEVFTVVATYNNKTSAYVPIVSYTCDEQNWPNYCEEITSPVIQTIIGIVFFLGLFGCYFGHKFFKTGMFLLGLFSGSLIAYILIAISEQNANLESNILSSALIGVASGLFWLSVWSYFGIPIISVGLSNLVVGFLFASILFYIGIGDFEIMQFDVNYWMLFLSIIISTGMILSIITQQANMLACSILGAYCVIIPIDRYIGANLKYILINVLRRSINEDFKTAVIDPPFQNRDLALIILWLSLAISGYGYQLYQQKGRPPFPPPPYMQRRLEGVNLQRSEREPLIASNYKPYYAILTTPGGSNVEI